MNFTSNGFNSPQHALKGDNCWSSGAQGIRSYSFNSAVMCKLINIGFAHSQFLRRNLGWLRLTHLPAHPPSGKFCNQITIILDSTMRELN
ncbi:hypothetical protein H6P81_015997 [Aristolochia fimbriata]|uniref:Uncharacterized protein n=1 Tax=Aristolochia fimbriata TaxID=158543 RepID=A0AAV7EAV6_ARIFI|nr:hypothetical protein H6P81_015997 [Aristolochia fimbriata]